MTGIAFGNLDIPKMSMGDTPIVKASVGDTLVWPAAPVENPIGFLNKVQQTTSAASGTPCAWPSSATAGDMIIFIERITHNTAGAVPASQYPPGFTPIHPAMDAQSTTARYCSSYRIVTAQDVIDQTPIQGMPQVSTSGSVKYALLWRGYVGAVKEAIVSVQVLEANVQATIGDPSPQVMSNSAPKQLLNLATYSGLSVAQRTWTGASWDEELNINTTFYLKYLASSSTGAITVDMVDNSNNNILASMTLNCNNTP